MAVYQYRCCFAGSAWFVLGSLISLCTLDLSAAAAYDHAPAKTNAFLALATNLAPMVVTTNYYRFGGTNHSQIRAAMKEARPWKNKQVYDALTEWNVDSHYRIRHDGEQFVLEAIEVSTKVRITLPFWIPGKPVPRDLVDRWNKCVIGLITHEQGHAVLAFAAGNKVQKRLSALPACGSPQEMAMVARRTVVETLWEFRQRERRYDEVTQHGYTQGAVFVMRPPEATQGTGSPTSP